jgi:DHA2 family multidrug resistance protein-like MFS transporter
MKTNPAPAAPADENKVNVRAVVTTSLALTMAVLDGAIANIALPSITSDFHISPADSIWAVNSYQMAVLVLLLPLASLGEILGYRRIYTIGLGLLCAGLLLLGLTGGANPMALAGKLAICGIGFGLFQAPNNRAMLSAAPPHRGGAAGGMLSTARLLGQSCGTAAAAVSLAATSGPSEALLIGAGLGALGALINSLR